MVNYSNGDGRWPYGAFAHVVAQAGKPKRFLYVVFGILTTLINIAVFALCSQYFRLSWALGNGIAWVLSMLFAFHHQQGLCV